jgi:glycosyltransferase involved in cell wall biosynthesis
LHIDPVKEWRGGQQQVVYLHEGLLRLGYHSVLVCSPGSELAQYCQKNKLPFYTIQIRGEWDIFSLKELKTIVRQENPGIIHLHSAPAVTIGLYLKLFNRNLKLIATRRVDFSVKKPLIGSWKYNNRFLDKIVCISQNIRKVMERDGVRPSKLEVIESGINIQKFDDQSLSFLLREEYDIPKDHILIGTVAALVGHKDYPTLIKAAKLVTDTIGNVTFFALGDGPNKNELAGLTDELNLTKRFIFCGFRKDVRSYLKQLDIFVFASKMEGMGTSVLDAEACGLPIVATMAGGIPEIVVQNKNGLLVPVQNPEKLAEAIIRLIKEPITRSEFGMNSREIVKKSDKQIMIEKNVLLYEKLLSEKN